jgi:hypothetical protein
MPELPIEPETAWVGVEDLPVEFANTFAAPVHTDSAYLTGRPDFGEP